MSGSQRVRILSVAKNQFLDSDTFKTIIDKTPLTSIDLVVRDVTGRVLLGQRLNRPAKGGWEGRILNNESLANAFKRLTFEELGIELEIENAKYFGLYELFYEDSIYTDEEKSNAVTTHYVVNGFEVTLPVTKSKGQMPSSQHDDYHWFSKEELMASNVVHEHSKWYFESTKGYL